MKIPCAWFRGLVIAAAVTIPSLAFAVPVHYVANLTTLNNSGVSGQANLFLDGNLLTVNIKASGLEAGKVHPQHIHGMFDSSGKPAESITPTLAQDANGDGVIELGEGATTYGPILIPLTSPPGGALADFPTAPDGTINFSQTYDLTDSGIYNDGFHEADVLPLDLREIVLHGLDAPIDLTDGGVSYKAGEYDPVLPVASGEIALATPEPAAVGMLAFGLLGIVGLALRTRKRD